MGRPTVSMAPITSREVRREMMCFHAADLRASIASTQAPCVPILERDGTGCPRGGCSGQPKPPATGPLRIKLQLVNSGRLGRADRQPAPSDCHPGRPRASCSGVTEHFGKLNDQRESRRRLAPSRWRSRGTWFPAGGEFSLALNPPGGVAVPTPAGRRLSDVSGRLRRPRRSTSAGSSSNSRHGRSGLELADKKADSAIALNGCNLRLRVAMSGTEVGSADDRDKTR